MTDEKILEIEGKVTEKLNFEICSENYGVDQGYSLMTPCGTVPIKSFKTTAHCFSNMHSIYKSKIIKIFHGEVFLLFKKKRYHNFKREQTFHKIHNY